MKKIIRMVLFLLPFLGFSLSSGNPSGASETEVSLYNQLTFSYNSGFYPGCLQYAERLQTEFPDSFFLGKTLRIKGECLVRTFNFEEAEDALVQAVSLNSEDKDSLLDSHFWLGRCYELTGANEKALQNYALCVQEKDSRYFSDALLNSGDIFIKKEDFSSAARIFEYAVENGPLFSGENYVSSVLKLSQCYNNTKRPAETIKLYSTLTEADFSRLGAKKTSYLSFMELAGEAYELNGNYKKAYDLYCAVLKSGEKSLASDALKRAYIVSSSHRKEVGADPGEVLSDAQKTLSESPELLGEFWTRLGSDAFGSGDFDKAVSYFDEAEKNVPVDLFLFALLYRAQIAAGKIPDKKSAALAEKKILESRGILNKENEKVWDRESYILLTRYASVQENWEDVKKYASNIVPLDEDSRYFLALAYYSTGDYKNCTALLKSKPLELHALSLAKSGDLKNAAFVYNDIENSKGLTDDEKLNYAKVLLLSGRYREAQIAAAQTKLPEGKYILGLSQFNTWSWPYAEESFSAFLKNPGKNATAYVSYALFYLGYSQYRQGKTKEAYTNLSNFVHRYPKHELFYNGEIAAANSAVQNFNYEAAAEHARSAVQVSRNDADKENAVLLCARIYSDAKSYDKAIKLLSSYVQRNDDFGMKSLFQTAQTWEKTKDYEKADASYKEIYERFSDKKLSEEAMYRRGEVYYNGGVYDKAVKCFEEYTHKFPNGSFVDAAWYFTAESLEKSGNSERAILQYKALTEKFPQSTYVYSSARSLVFLYRARASYDKALEYTNFLLSKYASQAKSDGINDIADDLKALSSGKTEQMVEKENLYASQKGSQTAQGRKTGSELVRLYAERPSYQEPAITLAETLLPLQKKNLEGESLYAAWNAEFLGKKYRELEKNKQAAEMYLLAAEYYRMNEADENAAASLYGSYEAFRAAGLTGDANDTAQLLKKLYPESRQARNVKVQ